MTTESNCTAHNAPHDRHGQCVEWRRVYDAAPKRESEWGIKDLPEDFPYCSWEPDRWHEPHEGITGAQRTDDLLDLTGEALSRRLIMCAMANAFHETLLIGNAPPIVERMRSRFCEPFASSTHNFVPGDLVIEVTTLYGGDRREKWELGFGTYITDRTEWASTIQEWEALIEEDKAYYDDLSNYDVEANLGPRSTDHAWYIQYGPNPEAVCRFTNCSFVALPTSYGTLEKLKYPTGTRVGNGVVITRDSLLGSLADSGFSLGNA
jgi:hypothetical protein